MKIKQCLMLSLASTILSSSIALGMRELSVQTDDQSALQRRTFISKCKMPNRAKWEGSFPVGDLPKMTPEHRPAPQIPARQAISAQ